MGPWGGERGCWPSLTFYYVMAHRHKLFGECCGVAMEADGAALLFPGKLGLGGGPPDGEDFLRRADFMIPNK